MIYTLTAPSPVRWGLFFALFPVFCAVLHHLLFSDFQIHIALPLSPACQSAASPRCIRLTSLSFVWHCPCRRISPLCMIQKIHCRGRNQPFCVSAGTEDFPTFFKRCTGRTRQCTKPDTCFARSRVNEKDQLFRLCTEDGLLSYHIRPIAVRISRIRIMPRAASNSGIRNMSSVYFLLVSVTSTIRA